MQVYVQFDRNSEAGAYLVACARIRKMSVSHLFKTVMETVAKDQLVLAVLDDDSNHQHERYEHGFREPRAG